MSNLPTVIFCRFLTWNRSLREVIKRKVVIFRLLLIGPIFDRKVFRSSKVRRSLEVGKSLEVRKSLEVGKSLEVRKSLEVGKSLEVRNSLEVRKSLEVWKSLEVREVQLAVID